MNIIIKSPDEISVMSAGGKILAQILQQLKQAAQAGVKTKTLDEIAEKLINEHHVTASFKNYRGYPACICTSVNEEVVHAIPSERELVEGDVVSIDCGIIYGGLHVDATVIAKVEPLDPALKKFIQDSEYILAKAIEVAVPGNYVGDISHTIESLAKEKGYSPVKELTGHGVGRSLHEPPQIPNYGKKGSGPALKPGMTLAIEPILNMGEAYVKTLHDGWTVVTKDGSPSIQIEHTIAITEHGNKILTQI